MTRHVYVPKDGFNPREWDGDPASLPPDVVRELQRNEHLAARTFANRCEAFNAGLALGAAAAREVVEDAVQP